MRGGGGGGGGGTYWGGDLIGKSEEYDNVHVYMYTYMGVWE